jgi:hypothetical protein
MCLQRCSLFGAPKKLISGKINNLQPLLQNNRVGVGPRGRP